MKIDFEAYVAGETARIYEAMMQDKIPLEPLLERKIVGMIADRVILRSIERAEIILESQVRAGTNEAIRDALIKPYLVDDSEAVLKEIANMPDPLPEAKPEWIG